EEIAIIGSGNSAHALACYLSSQGHRIHLWARNLEKLKHVIGPKKIFARGVLEGIFPVETISDDPAAVLSRCTTVFVATTTNPYAEIAQRLSPHLRAGQRVVLFSSKFGGSQDFSYSLGRKDMRVIETAA
ncbi:unnamed protein product, partial [Phaeothamnion confervicola]